MTNDTKKLLAEEDANMNAEQKLMHKAWDLVSPRKQAMDLAERGELSQEQADKTSWKGMVRCFVPDRLLAETGLTIAQVAQSVGFFTATEASVRRTEKGVLFSDSDPEPGYMVTAPGYYAGPCN